MALGLRPGEPILEQVKTPGSGSFVLKHRPRALFISGGVADFVYGPVPDAGVFAYGDIGVLLGRALRGSRLPREFPLVRGAETIRATVTGAGSYTVNLSGSTGFYRGAVFPRKNLPVLRLGEAAETALFQGNPAPLLERLAWFRSQEAEDFCALALTGIRNPGYTELKAAAEGLARAGETFPDAAPLVILLETDMAKALGQMVAARGEAEGRPLAVLDSLRPGDHSYIDLARPVMGGIAVPVVIKTLIFG